MSNLHAQVVRGVKRVLPNVFSLPDSGNLLLNQNGNQYKFKMPMNPNKIDRYIDSAITHFVYEIRTADKQEVA